MRTVALLHTLLHVAGILACLDGYMNIAMEATEASYQTSSFLTPIECPLLSYDASKAPVVCLAEFTGLADSSGVCRSM